MDKSEFEAALERAKADLAQQQANWETAKVQLKRCQELFNKNAGTGKDLDNAVGMEQNTKAAVLAAQANLRQAELNLGYTTITSPLKGLSSRTAKQDGSYLTPGPEGLLTYVVQIDPIWVNFSVSENERLKLIAESLEGRLILPEHEKEGEKIEDQLEYVVELVLADGSVFPERGRVKFAEPSFSPETGTFLVRAELANPQELLRPGQFVHVRLLGAKRPKAILVPQRAVMQGARGHFVWAVDAQGKADFTDVEVGDWHGDDWFITSGLKAGMRVVVDGGIKLSSGMPLRIASAPPAPPAKGKSPVAPAPAKPSSRDKQ
jgi:membrane fusion protein (multidrug efflux system)